MIDSAPSVSSRDARQPVFNLPPVIAGLAGILVVVHVVRDLFLSDAVGTWVILAFGFIPLRELDPSQFGAVLPGTDWAPIWSFVTYAFLHGDWMHLIVNGVWLAAFGSAVAWRLGATRFLLFSALGTVAGAAAHLAVSPQSFIPMVGASAAISAHMAGACRFIFSTGGPLWGAPGGGRYNRPALPLARMFSDRRALMFLGVWFAVNLVFGLTGAGSGLTSGAIAWDAHIGGFLAGLFLFPLFDPVARQ